MATFCDDTDFRHFPDDVYKCCFFLEPLVNQVTSHFFWLLITFFPIFGRLSYFLGIF
jgi:hypothetical protein